MARRLYEEGMEMEKRTYDVESLTTEKDLLAFIRAHKEVFGEDPRVKNSQPEQYIFGKIFGIKEGEKVIAGGTLTFENQKRPKRRIGWLANSFVDKEHRGTHLAHLINRAREELAKKEGCIAVNCHIEMNNPIGFVTKFNDGFELTKIIPENVGAESNDLPGYMAIMEKSLETKVEEESARKPEWQQVELVDVPRVQMLLHQGWRGVDMKNKPGVDKKSNDPAKWILIMEKKNRPVWSKAEEDDNAEWISGF